MQIRIDGGKVIISDLGYHYHELRALGMTYDRHTRSLEAPLGEQILSSLNSRGYLPQSMLPILEGMRTHREEIEAMAQSEKPLFDYPLRAQLYKHQMRGANMAMTTFKDSPYQGKGFGLLYEMGAGKTITALAIMGQLYKMEKIKRALIVAPTSVCSVWVDEIKKFAKYSAHAVHVTGTKAQRLELIRGLSDSEGDALKVLIINYESVHRDGIYEALRGFNPEMIVADESQRIKTHNAKQSKAMHALGDRADYKLILTGTPVQNNAIDFWSQYRFLDKSVLGTNFYAFKNRYCVMGGYDNHQIIGYKNLPELTSKVHSVALRVTKEECLDLPDKTFMYTRLEWSPKERFQYDKLRIQSVTELEESGEEVTANTVLTKILRLQQLTGGFIRPDESERYERASTTKLDALEDILDDYVLGTGKKLVIFARFRPEIAAIESLVAKKGIEARVIHGDVPIEKRGELVDDFQTKDEVKVFIAQLATAGLGITLHAASTAVFYSWDYNYANYQQALARIHRIGQKERCTYIHLVIDRTIDSVILKALEKKEDLAKTLVDNWKEIFKEDRENGR